MGQKRIPPEVPSQTRPQAVLGGGENCQDLNLNLGPWLCLAVNLLTELPEMLDSALSDPLDNPVLYLDFC